MPVEKINLMTTVVHGPNLFIPTTNTTYEPLRNSWAWDKLENGKGRVNWMHARADAPYSQGGVIHASVT
jgi:hypothetical protein